MIYTINFDLDIDSDEIYEDGAIAIAIKNALDSASIIAKNIKILDVND